MNKVIKRITAAMVATTILTVTNLSASAEKVSQSKYCSECNRNTYIELNASKYASEISARTQISGTKHSVSAAISGYYIDANGTQKNIGYGNQNFNDVTVKIALPSDAQNWVTVISSHDSCFELDTIKLTWEA